MSFFNKKKKIDAKYWREIWWSPSKARAALIGLMVPHPTKKGRLSKVEYVTLESGAKIPVEEVTEEQAHEFMKQLCPTWAHPSGEK